MSLFKLNLYPLGLDISDKSFKLAQAVPAGGRFKLQAWGSVKVKPGLVELGEIKDREQVADVLKKLKDSVTGKLLSDFVVASLPETKTFLKVFKLARSEETEMGEDPLKKAIEEELPKEIPLPIENIIYDYKILRQTPGFWQVLIGVTPKDIVLSYTETIKAAGFKLMALEIEAQAIARAFLPSQYQIQSKKVKKLRMPKFLNFLNKKIKNVKTDKLNQPAQAVDQNRPILIADLGANRSSLIVWHQGTIQFTRSLELSGSQLDQQIADALKLTSVKAEQAKLVCGLDKKKCKGKVYPLLIAWADQLVSEIQATARFYKTVNKSAEQEFQEILLGGGGAGLLTLDEYLSTQLNVPVKAADPLRNFRDQSQSKIAIPKKSLLGFTTAIGLAMREI